LPGKRTERSISLTVAEIAGGDTAGRLFGLGVDDTAGGEGIDLLVSAWHTARRSNPARHRGSCWRAGLDAKLPAHGALKCRDDVMPDRCAVQRQPNQHDNRRQA
jgi:hypothetical protein